MSLERRQIYLSSFLSHYLSNEIITNLKSVIQVLSSLKQEDSEFEASLGYITRSGLTKEKILRVRIQVIEIYLIFYIIFSPVVVT